MENQTSKICILDTETANQIAAGEVVERPVSVVKELVENAIDAGAKRITVSITQNASENCISKIEVADDGTGMNRADLETAFYRHATSKIRKITDLNSVLSLGFRGEALPSIASVSKVTVRSRSVDEMSGYIGSVIDGRMKITGEAGMPVGTKITVDDLFYNTPARKKFLKSAVVEQGHITKLISNFILSSPQIAFILKTDSRTVLHSSGSGSMQQAVVAVYGAETLGNLVPVAYADANIKIYGFVSKPPFSRSNRKYYHFYVNGRLVKSRELSYMLELAYETLLPERRYPVGIIYLQVDPKTIDVNVHPAKTEIRFRQLDVVKDAMSAAVKAALAPKVAVPKANSESLAEAKPAAAKNAAQAENNIKQTVGNLEIQSESGKTFKLSDLFSFGTGKTDNDTQKKNYSSDKPKTADAATDEALKPAAEAKQSNLTAKAEIKPLIKIDEDNEQGSLKIAEAAANPLSADLDMSVSKQSDFTSRLFSMLVGIGDEKNSEKQADSEKNNEDKIKEEKKQTATTAEKQECEIPNPFQIYNEYLGYYDDNENSENGEKTEKANPMAGLNGLFNLGALLGGQKAPQTAEKPQKIEAEQEELFAANEVNLFTVLQPMGQLNASYIIASYGEDLYIIDQHAAHERILYEEFCRSFSQNQNQVSMLAVPAAVDLGDLPKELLLQNLEAVTDFGFIVEYLGGSTFVLRGVPLWFANGKDNENVRRSDNFRQSAEDFFLDMMDRIVGNAQGESNAVDFSALNKEELFTMACKNAVKANWYLTDADITWIMQKLAVAEKPLTCPHGRPTVIKISDSEIRNRFMRS